MPESAADEFMIAGKTLACRVPIARSRDILDSIESLKEFARDHGPGRYDVDEHSFDPFPWTKVSARALGKLIQHQDGQVILDPIPW
jgi:hypothetical protein